MNKQQSIASLEEAKRFLDYQMKNIKCLIDGKPRGTLGSIYKMNCDFGHWLYDEENNFKSLLGFIFYRELDAHHTQWHEVYRKIYLMYFEEPKPGEPAREKKISDMDVDKCKLYYTDLVKSTEAIEKCLVSCKRRLEALSEEKFK